AMAMGERTPLALLNYAASARMAVGEALTNIAAADIGDLTNVKLSANWMSAAGHPGEDAGLYEAVKAVGEDLCPALGLTIPVGKDSMSMKTRWQDKDGDKAVTAPLSLVITAFGRVRDIRRTVTPQLRLDKGDSKLLLIDLGRGKNRLGGSALAQVYRQLGDQAPDVDRPELLAGFFRAIQQLIREKKVVAYHDRSDGGLFATVAEMAFAGHCGVEVALDSIGDDDLSAIFNEELGAVIQVLVDDMDAVQQAFADEGLAEYVHIIGRPMREDVVRFNRNGEEVLSHLRSHYRAVWAEMTHQMQRLRDNPNCADEEFAAKQKLDDPGLSANLTFDPSEDIAAPYISTGRDPVVAILREQGVNSHVEMAAAFDRAGFAAIDVHMSDILSGRVSLEKFNGLVACVQTLV
ncbi:phosphoribosylformylglycinamidine synthase, partial [Pseudidiomarina aestuarii]